MSGEATPSWRQDPRPTAELFERAKCEQQHSDGSDENRNAVPILHRRANAEVFQAAEQWCRSEDATERIVAADVLAQLGCGEPAAVAESIALLIPLLSDREPAVVAAAAFALGQRRAPAAVV